MRSAPKNLSPPQRQKKKKQREHRPSSRAIYRFRRIVICRYLIFAAVLLCCCAAVLLCCCAAAVCFWFVSRTPWLRFPTFFCECLFISCFGWWRFFSFISLFFFSGPPLEERPLGDLAAPENRLQAAPRNTPQQHGPDNTQQHYIPC